MKTLFEFIVRLRIFCLLLTSIRFLATSPAKADEDSKVVVFSINLYQIKSRLHCIDMKLYYLHKEQKRALEVVKHLIRVHFVNLSAKSESDHTLLCNSFSCIGHLHIKDLLEDYCEELHKFALINCYNYYQHKKIKTEIEIYSLDYS